MSSVRRYLWMDDIASRPISCGGETKTWSLRITLLGAAVVPAERNKGGDRRGIQLPLPKVKGQIPRARLARLGITSKSGLICRHGRQAQSRTAEAVSGGWIVWIHGQQRLVRFRGDLVSSGGEFCVGKFPKRVA